MAVTETAVSMSSINHSNETMREHHSIMIPIDSEQQCNEESNQEKSTKHSLVSRLNKILNKEACVNIMHLFWVMLFFLGVASCAVSLSVPKVEYLSFQGLELWQWSLIITSILGGPVLSRFVLRIITILLNHEISLQINAIYYFVELLQSSLFVLWFAMILLAWIWVLDEPSYLGVSRNNKQPNMTKLSKTKPIITSTLVALLVGSILWLIKDLLIIMMKSYFHIKVFFKRIKEVCEHHRSMKALTDGYLCLEPINDESKDKMVGCSKLIMLWDHFLMIVFRVKPSKTTAINKLDFDKMISKDMVSSWNMNILMKEIATTKFQYKINKDDQFNVIDTEKDAKEASNALFKAILDFESQDNRRYNIAEVEEKIKKTMEQKGALQMYQWFENAGFSYLDGEVTGKELIESKSKEIISQYMVWAFKYHQSLVRGLCDNKELIKQLNRFVNLSLVVATIVLWLIMTSKEIREVLFVIGSAIVASAFAFGDFCKKLLDTFSFVFLMHPFDAGDYCLIDNVMVIIEEVNLLTTVAITLDDQKTHFPNATLVGKNIINLTRSPPNMKDFVVFFLIRSHVSQEEIDTLKTNIRSYIDKRSRYWEKEHNLVLEYDTQDREKIKATLHVKHKLNYYEPMERNVRKSHLLEYLIAILPKNKDEDTSSNAQVTNK